jgi:hypothetical protein
MLLKPLNCKGHCYTTMLELREPCGHGGCEEPQPLLRDVAHGNQRSLRMLVLILRGWQCLCYEMLPFSSKIVTEFT